MSPAEAKIAKALFALASESEEYCCFPFKTIARQARVPIKSVRRPVRALVRKGYAVYERGLWSFYSNRPAGAGYRLSDSGLAFMEALQPKPIWPRELSP